jgi:hypothetical protein
MSYAAFVFGLSTSGWKDSESDGAGGCFVYVTRIGLSGLLDMCVVGCNSQEP